MLNFLLYFFWGVLYCYWCFLCLQLFDGKLGWLVSCFMFIGWTHWITNCHEFISLRLIDFFDSAKLLSSYYYYWGGVKAMAPESHAWHAALFNPFLFYFCVVFHCMYTTCKYHVVSATCRKVQMSVLTFCSFTAKYQPFKCLHFISCKVDVWKANYPSQPTLPCPLCILTGLSLSNNSL